MTKAFFLILLSSIYNLTFAQSDPDRNSRFYGEFSLAKEFHIDYTYQKIVSGSLVRLNTGDFSSQASEATLELGYYLLAKKLSLGLGFGIHSNSTYRINGAPLFASLKYFVIPERNSFIIYTDVGQLLKLGEIWNNGDFFEIGIGQKLFFTKKLAGIVKLGANFKRFSLSDEPLKGSSEYFTSRGIQLSAGLYF